METNRKGGVNSRPVDNRYASEYVTLTMFMYSKFKRTILKYAERRATARAPESVTRNGRKYGMLRRFLNNFYSP